MVELSADEAIHELHLKSGVVLHREGGWKFTQDTACVRAKFDEDEVPYLWPAVARVVVARAADGGVGSAYRTVAL